ncbi:MAG: VOC family protein [Boseongicola sp.]|nr:VOC family protein [Boseongicola sp.]MDD9978691.1 VOC family protein [Boseongicola sp.]
MIDHITFGVSDFDRSTEFYDKAFAPLGVRRLFDVPQEQTNGINVSGYGDDRPWFWIAEERPTTGMLHIALRTKSTAEVDAFHDAAIRAGGTDNGRPGLRPQYHQGYYAAFVLDPDGHNIEAVFHETVSEPR